MEGRHLLADVRPDEDEVELRARQLSHKLAGESDPRSRRACGRDAGMPVHGADQLPGQHDVPHARRRFGVRQPGGRGLAPRRQRRQDTHPPREQHRVRLPVVHAGGVDRLPLQDRGDALDDRLARRHGDYAPPRHRGRAGRAHDVRARGRQARGLHLRAGVARPQLEPAPLPLPGGHFDHPRSFRSARHRH